jgi:hypothetical protein
MDNPTEPDRRDGSTSVKFEAGGDRHFTRFGFGEDTRNYAGGERSMVYLYMVHASYTVPASSHPEAVAT